jgi:MoxR-like ATPase
LFDGRFAASIEDVKAVAAPALRHRILLSFEGEAEGVRPDAIVQEILEKVAPGKA